MEPNNRPDDLVMRDGRRVLFAILRNLTGEQLEVSFVGDPRQILDLLSPQVERLRRMAAILDYQDLKSQRVATSH